MSRNRDHSEQSCEQCETLINRWLTATEQLSRSVAELTGKMGIVPRHVYDSLHLAAEAHRRTADEAEKTLFLHRQSEHGKSSIRNGKHSHER
jgi:hypothetical protein